MQNIHLDVQAITIIQGGWIRTHWKQNGLTKVGEFKITIDHKNIPESDFIDKNPSRVNVGCCAD